MHSQYRVERWTGDSTPSASQLRQVMESEGFSVFQWSDPPGAYYSPHTHEEEQSHWIVSGMLELNVTGHGTLRLGTGDRDFMPANTEHEARAIGNTPLIYLIGARN